MSSCILHWSPMNFSWISELESHRTDEQNLCKAIKNEIFLKHETLNLDDAKCLSTLWKEIQLFTYCLIMIHLFFFSVDTCSKVLSSLFTRPCSYLVGFYDESTK